MLIITHKRAIPLLLIFAWTAVLLIIEQSFDLLSIGINLIFTASQVFWFRRAGELGQKVIGSKTWRRVLAAAGLTAYVFLLVFNLSTWERSAMQLSPQRPRCVRRTSRPAQGIAQLR